MGEAGGQRDRTTAKFQMKVTRALNYGIGTSNRNREQIADIS